MKYNANIWVLILKFRISTNIYNKNVELIII